jgi:hypothetical protein
VTNANSSPRPSILRKRTNEGYGLCIYLSVLCLFPYLERLNCLVD